jgi:hypothetical protein
MHTGPYAPPMNGMQHGGSRTHIGGAADGAAVHLQFTDEAQRQDFYRQSKHVHECFLIPAYSFEGDTKVPAYSTLNLDVLPTPTFLQSLDNYQAKIDPELLKEMVKSAGMTTADERVYKMLAAMVEMKLLDLLKEVRNVSATSNSA